MVASIDKQTRGRAHLSLNRASPNPFCSKQKIVLTHSFTSVLTLPLKPKALRKDVVIFGYIKVYFSEQEKERLQQTATEQNLALSQLIRLQCREILNPTYTIIPSLLDAKDLSEYNGDKYVKVFLSESEHEKLQLAAKERGIGMSRLIYERLHANLHL